MVVPRDYQAADVAAVIEAHKAHQSVIGRAATGLGKAVELAMLAKHYSQFGRVMVLVDVTKLVRQLAGTIEWVTGVHPGIEMGEERALNGGAIAGSLYDNHDRVVVSTVQTQYSGKEGFERFRQFDPSEFSLLLLDECELFLAPKSFGVVQWYRSNPNLRIFGTTATPFRTDGVAMANLFDAVAFDRDIRWGIDNGWLVPVKQAFVQVSIDFSTLTVRKNGEGERDYSEAEIAEKLNSETHLIELAKGIIHVAEDRKSIIVCPDVDSARAIAHYLNGQKPACAQCIYGELGDDEKDDIFTGFDQNAFQYLTSVSMLTKGFDQPDIRAVINCRKTQSRRLFAQILGRGTRPLKGVVDGPATPEDRKAAIAASPKPNMLMVNMVGIDDCVRDMTVIDILGSVDDQQVLDRAKKIAEKEGLDTDEAVAKAQLEIEFEQDDARRQAEAEQAAMDEEDLQRIIRGSINVEATVAVEYSDGLGPALAQVGTQEVDVTERRASVLRQFKYPDEVIRRLPPERIKDLSRKLIARANKGMVVSYKHIKFLRGLGATDQQIEAMRRADVDAFVESKRGKRGAA